eukprot:4645064-Amphidinium_carterae.2
MESATDALDFDFYVEEKNEKQSHFGNQDGFEAYRRLAIRYAPRTLGRNLTTLPLMSIIDHDFGSDESQMLDKIASWRPNQFRWTWDICLGQAKAKEKMAKAARVTRVVTACRDSKIIVGDR